MLRTLGRDRKRFAKVVLGLALVAIAVALRPAALGGPLSLVIVSGQSMEPTMHSGDLAIVMSQDHYAVGDVVAFQPSDQDGATTSESLVIHRVTDTTADGGITTQGDGNDWPDPWDTGGKHIAGEMAFFLPNAGYAILYLREPVILAAALAALTAFLVALGPKPTASVPAQHHEPATDVAAGSSA